ncbi:hypothetical protein FGF80_12770 [Natrinema pallidum]|uniref:Uncharacterized protein n=2 Tax=Natrinema pallidum TaxID=69527 RepID=A0A4P9TIS2_9EURY|nr:hypothetical protein FGF80_12770 [Natrinema pallidum]
MEGTIKDEIAEGVGLKIIDDREMEHRTVVGFNGEIKAHKSDTYPKPSERTNEEDESFSQARRFARYHVYRELDYDTIPNTENPDRIAAVLLAILDLGEEAFDRHFRTLFEQVASHDFPEIEPPLDLPPEVYSQEALVYKQHVYLEEDLETFRKELQQPASEILDENAVDDLLSGGNPISGTGSGGFMSSVHSLLGGTSDSVDLTIEGVSGIDTMYYEDTNDDRTIEGPDPFDRDPDATIELIPAQFDEDVFGFYLCHNLLCQIRDCFIGMGLEPPRQYRTLGHGKYKYTGKYRHFDFYPDYWDPEADIPGYRAPVPL